MNTDPSTSISDSCLRERLESDAKKFTLLQSFKGHTFYLSSDDTGSGYNKALLARRIDGVEGVFYFIYSDRDLVERLIGK